MIYLDHNATTPITPEVFEAMAPYLRTEWGNPSSTYSFGAKLKAVLEKARAQTAELIGAHADEIVFTSCATESNNSAIHAALTARPGKRHLVTSVVEHSSVLSYCKKLEGDGFRVTKLPVDRDGLLSISGLEAILREDTAMISLMWANNETGVLFPVEAIAHICRAHGVLFHCDAVQVAGKLPIDVSKLPLDYLSLSGHKFNAPKGIGALYIRRGTPFTPFLHGGHQEYGRRGGTQNVAFVVGIGMAAVMARRSITDYDRKVRPLRDALEGKILHSVRGAEMNGHRATRLANTTSIAFPGVNSEALLLLLDQDGVCASSGSACLADADEPSHVIEAMKPQKHISGQTLRFSLGITNTEAEVKVAATAVSNSVQALRNSE